MPSESGKPDKTTHDDWPQASPREMIDWLAFFVASRCETKDDTRMYMQVRDFIVRHFGRPSMDTHETITREQAITLLRRYLELSNGVRSISIAYGKEEISRRRAMDAFERIIRDDT